MACIFIFLSSIERDERVVNMFVLGWGEKSACRRWDGGMDGFRDGFSWYFRWIRFHNIRFARSLLALVNLWLVILIGGVFRFVSFNFFFFFGGSGSGYRCCAFANTYVIFGYSLLCWCFYAKNADIVLWDEMKGIALRAVLGCLRILNVLVL